jgi:5-bromo-4-chloroindolyl phosphate hydrolysis protein
MVVPFAIISFFYEQATLVVFILMAIMFFLIFATIVSITLIVVDEIAEVMLAIEFIFDSYCYSSVTFKLRGV